MKRLAALLALVAALPSTARAAKYLGVTVQGTSEVLVRWDSAAPQIILASVPITGIIGSSTIRGLEFDRNAQGFQRLCIATGGGPVINVYNLNPLTGFAAKLSEVGGPPAQNSGEFYGLTGFNGSLKSVNDGGRITGLSTTYNTGGVQGVFEYGAADVNAGKTPRLVHFFGGATAVDSLQDAIVNVPNSGNPAQLETIAELDIDIDDIGAADDDDRGNVFAALLPAGQTKSSFYQLNPQTGATLPLGLIGDGLLITAMTFDPRPVPEPSTAILLAVGVVACVWVRR